MYFRLSQVYTCSECPRNYVQHQALLTHMETHYADRNRRASFRCNPCGKRFTKSSHLHEHLAAKHLRKKTFECTHCGQLFFYKRNLAAHSSKAHLDQTINVNRQFLCDECGESFLSASNLHYHKKFGHEQSGYRCGVCQKIFLEKKNLTKHDCAGAPNLQ